jgi:hypothetical protein
MIRKALALTAPVLAAAALVPAGASATTLHSAPTLRHIHGGRIQLQFTVDKTLPTKHGKVATKISVNGDPVDFLKRAGRHGLDYRYTALAAVGGLHDGQKYKVRFHFAGGDVVRLAKVL